MQKTTTALAVAAAAIFLAMPAQPASAQTITWDAPPEAKNIKRPAPADAASAERGQKLYNLNCVPCHGQAGKGEGPMSKALNVHAGNFTDRARMSKQSDGEIYWKTAKGKTPMPVFEQKLSEKELWDVVAYVRTFAK
jgi:mono/diheme cytochrome c family protein